jgi:hypothetical protein
MLGQLARKRTVTDLEEALNAPYQTKASSSHKPRSPKRKKDSPERNAKDGGPNIQPKLHTGTSTPPHSPRSPVLQRERQRDESD